MNSLHICPTLTIFGVGIGYGQFTGDDDVVKEDGLTHWYTSASKS